MATSLAVEVLVPVLGVAGVAVGGFVTLQGQKKGQEAASAREAKRQEAAIARERHRHEETIEQENARARQAAQAAWLLLSFEVGNALEAVYEIRDKKKWVIGWHRKWSAAWEDGRRTLLLYPPEDAEDLRDVAAACARLDQLESAVNAGRDETAGELELSPRDHLFLWDMQQLLERACQALEYESRYERAAEPSSEEIKDWEKAVLAMDS